MSLYPSISAPAIGLFSAITTGKYPEKSDNVAIFVKEREISGYQHEKGIESPALSFHSDGMPFPSTPLTLLGRLKHQEMPRLWESSWEEFFDIYHNAVSVCVLGAFRRHGWHDVPVHDLQDVVIAVFESLFRGHESFDPAKGRFRQFLTTLCQRRVVDFIRSHARKSSKLTSLDADGFQESNVDPAFTKPSTEEEDAFRKALLATLLSALHAEVSPRTYMIFELVKLNGESPEDVAEQLGIQRGVVDNTVFKAMKKLREISKREDIQQEL